jgi:3-oxoacyl-[acyl-carrier-protein] synthase-3
MKGRGIFEFLLLEIPKDIKLILAAANASVESIDYFVLHQANLFMNEHIRRRMRMPVEKVPYSLGEFGNTSSVSIPITMVSKIANCLMEKPNKLFLCGFGVGLSWGSAIIPTGKIKISNLVEVDDE